MFFHNSWRLFCWNSSKYRILFYYFKKQDYFNICLNIDHKQKASKNEAFLKHPIYLNLIKTIFSGVS